MDCRYNNILIVVAENEKWQIINKSINGYNLQSIIGRIGIYSPTY